ncbi:MAG: recombinase family protein [Proteobacteria bacterium]|nr:recombinase family protein [Pseudomonadota bacterium]
MKDSVEKKHVSAKAFAYIRLSSQSQAWGDGERRQVEAAKEFAARHGLTIDETLSDIGVSAYRSKNSKGGALGTFLDLARDNVIEKGSMLIVESIDRLTRDEPSSALQLLLDIIKAEIRIGITSINMVMDSLTYVALFPIISEMARANSESEHKSKRSLANWVTKRLLAAQGTPVTSQCPLWMEVKNGEFCLIPERVEIVKRIYGMYSDGIGRGAIARALMNEGIPAWNKRRPVWHPSYIFKVLHNRAVVGDYEPETKIKDSRVAEERISDYYPAIISPELFNRIQGMSHVRRTGHSGRKGKKFANLFQGLAQCTVCGGTMRFLNRTHDKKREKPWAMYLVCSSGLEKLGCQNYSWYNYRVLENFILAGTLKEIDIIEAAGLHCEAERENMDLVEKLKAELDKADANIANLVSLLDDEALEDMNELKRALLEEHRKRKSLRERLATARGVAAEARQAADNTDLFRQAGMAPEGIDMSDDAVYARRVRISMQMRSMIDRVDCAPKHCVSIRMKSGTVYELEDGQWTRVEQRLAPVINKVITSRSFAGLAVTRLPCEYEKASDTEEEQLVIV